MSVKKIISVPQKFQLIRIYYMNHNIVCVAHLRLFGEPEDPEEGEESDEDVEMIDVGSILGEY